MRLPPPGSDPHDIALYVDSLVWESASDFRRRKCELDWDKALQLMFSEHWPANMPSEESGNIRLTLNRIVRCVMSMMVLQAGDPPEIKFVPRETGEPPMYFLRSPTVPGQPPQPSQEIDEAAAIKIKYQQALQQSAAAQLAAQGQPAPQQPANPLIEINDQTCCEALQTVFDGMDEECGFQMIFRENVYYKLQFGNQPTLYEFDVDKKEHVHTNVPPTHVFFQRTTADINRNPYSVVDEYVSSDDALAYAASRLPAATYEKIKTAIESLWTSNMPLVPGSQPYTKSAIFNQVFRRSGGFIRHAWLRNQPYPMTIDEALESGKVQVCNVPANPADVSGSGFGSNGPQSQANQSSSGGALDGSSGGYLPPATGSPAGVLPVPSTFATTQLPATGLPATADIPLDQANQAEALSPDELSEYMISQPQQKQMRQAYCLANGAEVTPPIDQLDPTTGLQRVVQTNPLWPMTLAIRQITIIGMAVVEDQRCRYTKLQVANNVNIPIAFSPLGMGEPKILEDLQRAINNVLSDLITWAKYNAVPPEVALKEVCIGLDNQVRKMRLKWGQVMLIPASEIPMGYKLTDCIDYLKTPEIPPDMWKLIDFLTKMIDIEGNQADVAQGNAAPGWSGEAIAALQNAHNQMVRASGLSTEDWLRQLTALKVESIAHLMTPQDCQKRCRKYPIEVWQVIHQRFANLNPIISVEIGSASGSSKQAETQQLINAKVQGAAPGISQETIMTRLGVDSAAELQQSGQEAQEMAATMPQPAQQPNNNGNGKQSSNQRA